MANKYIQDFIQYERNFKSASKNTIVNYEVDLRQMFEYLQSNKSMILKDKYIKQITKQDLEDFVASLKGRGDKPASVSTKNRKIASMKSFFEYLEGRIIERSPASRISAIQSQQKKEPKHLNLNQSIKLLDNIDDTRDKAIYATFLFAGVRLDELVELDMEDLKGEVMLIKGKGSKERVVQVSDALQRVLLDWIKVRSDVTDEDGRQPLFISKRNKRVSRSLVQKGLGKYLKKAKIKTKGITVHKLRHTAATLMYEGGTGVMELKEILGHANVQTTQIYTHIKNENLKKAVNNNPLNQIG